MNFSIHYSSIESMLKLCKKIKDGNVSEREVEDLLKHEDYRFEFSRYKGRVSEDEFKNYLLNLPSLSENDINNKDLKIHHRYYRDLLDNLDFYMDKTAELKRFTPELFNEQILIALKGLPDDINLPHLNFIFTVGIGQSYGYAHNNGMHFDFLQLMRDKSIEIFCSTISHEVHHVGMNLIHNKIDLNAISLEALFYLYFTGEGLAVKYCNNAEGVLSKSIYNGPKNIGLDSFTWEYLNGDFDNTMARFKETIENIRSNKIKTREELDKQISEYWTNPYIEGQDLSGIPLLKHFRLYSFGNDIWGIIHDCFGKDIVYDTLKNPECFPNIFNKALERIDREDLKIN